MFSRSAKTGIYILEGLNALATTYYFYYAYFLMRERFGFTTLQNLLLAAGMGFIYMFAAIFCGRFARKHGYFLSLKIGFTILGSAIGLGAFLESATAHVTIIAIGNVGMCFTWPAFQSIVSDREPSKRLQNLMGAYNFTWAACSAFAYFIGGAIIKKLGTQSMFYLPACIHFFQLAMTFWLEKHNQKSCSSSFSSSSSKIEKKIEDEDEDEKENEDDSRDLLASNVKPSLSPKTFLKMAWLTNPFAYVAVNTVVAIMPTIADRLHLSLKQAGFCCSVWFIIRAISFVVLCLCPGWHYRFGWLLTSYVAMVTSFAGILLAPALWVFVICQIFFGVALSLIYYSSIFYSLDADESKGDNAGFHEGMIGLGTGGGPAMGAAALYFFPQIPNANVMAVSGLLICGLVGLLWLRAKGLKPSS